MAEDIEEFIAEQKSRLARERQELQQQSIEKVYQGVKNGDNDFNNPDEKRRAFPSANQEEEHKVQNGGGLATFGQKDIKQKLRKERQEEYARFLKEKEARSAQNRTIPEGKGNSLPIGERTSAKSRAENQRRMEYQAYLKEIDARERQRREERLGHATREQALDAKTAMPTRDDGRAFNDGPVRKEAASQTPHPPPEYDDIDSRPPRPPRRGWGSPQPGPDYEDLLRKRREEEARYRRYGDLDYYPVRMSLKPSRSDPRLDRYQEEDGYYSRLRDSDDRRRVRFTDLEDPMRERTYVSDRPRHPPSEHDSPRNGYREYYGVTRSKTLPEMERSTQSLPKHSPRAKSATTSKEEGFVIGSRESNSAIQRKKELYRKELAQQIQEQKEAKKREREREREEELKIVAQNSPESTRRARGNAASTQPPQPASVPPPAAPAYAPSLLDQANTTPRVPMYTNQYPGGVATSTLPSNYIGSSIQPQVPNLGLADALGRPPPEPIGSLGLDEAYLRSRPTMLDQPFSIASNTSDPYYYYKLRNPMEPDPNYSGRHLFQPNPATIPPTGQVPSNVSNDSANTSLHPTVQYNEVINTSGLRSESAIRNYVGDSDLSPRAMKDPKSYQQQLLSQMKEKEMKKRRDREAQARYDAKVEAEAQVYNPWGKGGGGAPMRNAQGQVFADLKQLRKLNEQVLQDPSKSIPLYADTPGDTSGFTPTGAATHPTGLARAMSERGMNSGPPDQLGGGIGGGPGNTPTHENPTDTYKAELMQQVEDKKRREAEEKARIKEEEAKEERRLAEQRERMQREFELELAAKRKKEEEKQKQQEELQAKLEASRREAEERKREARRRVEQPVTTATENQPTRQRQVLSPPVPAVAKNQDDFERLKSPPIPTLQKKMVNRSPEEINGTPQQSPRHQTPKQTPKQTPRRTVKQITSRESKDDQRCDSSKRHSYPVRDESAGPHHISNRETPRSLDDDRIFSPRTTPTVDPTYQHDDPHSSQFERDGSEVGEPKNEKARLLSALERLRARYFKEGESVMEKPAKRKFDVVDWLHAIDPELIIYAPDLAANGYRSMKTLRRLDRDSLLDTCPGIKRGHVDAILHELQRTQTPNTLWQKTPSERDTTPTVEPFSEDESILGDLVFSDEEVSGTARSVSPPVPAVSNRERDGGERDVMSALSAMRRQLQSEQRRVQDQLDRHQEYSQRVGTKPPAVSRHASPQVDVFEVARHKGSGVSVRREPINHQAADEFKNLRGGSSQSRQRLLEQYPVEPHSNITLEAQQRALLKHQQSRLNEMKQEHRKKGRYSPNMDDLGRASQSPALQLESSSAFIGIESGETKEIPKEIYDFDTRPSPGPSKQPADPFGSVASFDSAMMERLTEKNRARNELLKALEPDTESLGDVDDILNQFLAKQSIGSPMLRSASRKSEDLSLWLKPSEG